MTLRSIAKSIQSDHEHIQMMLDEFWLQVGVTDWHVVFNPPEVTDKMRDRTNQETDG